MKEEISICRKNGDGRLVVIGTKRLWCELDEEKMEVYTVYHGERRTVHGNYLMPYIVLEA